VSDTLVFAGGGTGGHVYPMIAVADAVRAIAPEMRIVCVGTERGMETRVVPERGYELELMRVLPIRGNGVQGAVRGITRAAGSVPEARTLLKKLNPRAVFSVGGYAAGPVSLSVARAEQRDRLGKPLDRALRAARVYGVSGERAALRAECRFARRRTDSRRISADFVHTAARCAAGAGARR
jgi:hypothetical protein